MTARPRGGHGLDAYSGDSDRMDVWDATAAVGIVARMSLDVWLARLGAGGTYHCSDKQRNRSRSEH